MRVSEAPDLVPDDVLAEEVLRHVSPALLAHWQREHGPDASRVVGVRREGITWIACADCRRVRVFTGADAEPDAEVAAQRHRLLCRIAAIAADAGRAAEPPASL